MRPQAGSPTPARLDPGLAVLGRVHNIGLTEQTREERSTMNFGRLRDGGDRGAHGGPSFIHGVVSSVAGA